MSPGHQKFRHKLPEERAAITHKFNIAGHEGYLTVGLYEDGRPGEMFITMSKHGSMVSGLLDSIAVSVSVGLQYNVPLEVFVSLFKHRRFDPAGITNNPDEDLREATSVVDYIFRWMEKKFLDAPVESDNPSGLLTPGSSSEITEAMDPTK